MSHATLPRGQGRLERDWLRFSWGRKRRFQCQSENDCPISLFFPFPAQIGRAREIMSRAGPPPPSPCSVPQSFPVFHVLSINLGTPLFRLLKGFGTSASAAKWGPANEGRGRPSGGAESGFAAIIRRAWSIVGPRLVPNSGDNRQDTRERPQTRDKKEC